MKKILFVLLCVACGQQKAAETPKRPVDLAIEEILRINGQPSKVDTLTMEVIYTFDGLFSQMFISGKKTKNAIDKSLQLVGKGDDLPKSVGRSMMILSEYKWETTDCEITYEARQGSNRDSVYLRFWVTRK